MSHDTHAVAIVVFCVMFAAVTVMGFVRPAGAAVT